MADEEPHPVDVAESAVALAEAQTALANVAAAQVIAESNDEMAKVKENIECMNLKMTELEASLAETRSQLQAFQSSIPPKESEPSKETEPPKESAPEPPKESAPEPPKESASLASVEVESLEAKTRRKHRQVRRI